MANKILGFVEIKSFFKNSVDIWTWVWYYNKAVARESRNKRKQAVDRVLIVTNDTEVNFVLNLV